MKEITAKEGRKRLGWSQSQLAAAARVTDKTAANWDKDGGPYLLQYLFKFYGL